MRASPCFLADLEKRAGDGTEACRQLGQGQSLKNAQGPRIPPSVVPGQQNVPGPQHPEAVRDPGRGQVVPTHCLALSKATTSITLRREGNTSEPGDSFPTSLAEWELKIEIIIGLY